MSSKPVTVATKEPSVPPHIIRATILLGGTVAEWLACWTQALKGPGSNRSRDAIG